MLTVTRKEGESIILEPASDIDPATTVGQLLEDWRVEITVLGRGRGSGTTRIRVQAPRSISIVRKELQANPSGSADGTDGEDAQAA